MSAARTQNALLTVGAVLGSLCLIAALASVLFGIKPLMFKSGSMEPTIPTGGLALSVPADASEIRVGDIVSTENSTGTRITHRVAAIVTADGFAELTLKGDANDVVDAEVYPVTTVDRVFWSAPALGYAVAWLSSPVALFLGGLLAAYLLFAAFGGRPEGRRLVRSESHDARHSVARRARSARRRRQRGRRSAFRRTAGIALSGGLILSGGTVDGGMPAWAQFSDDAAAVSTFTAGKLSAPQDPTCRVRQSLIGLADEIVLSWSYNGAVIPAGYDVSVNAGSPTYTTTSSINLAANDASVSIVARLHSWSSQPLKVRVDYTWGTLGSSVTCTVVV